MTLDSTHVIAEASPNLTARQVSSSVAQHVLNGIKQTRPQHPLANRLNYLWMSVVVTMLILGDISATQGQPALWHSWRGPVMILVSLAFLCWYMMMGVIHHRVHSWPMPRRITYSYLIAGFVIILVLLTFSAGFGGLLFALMGMCFGLVSVRETTLAVGVATLIYMASVGQLPMDLRHLSITSDTAWGWFSTATSVGIVYVIGMLTRERFYRDHLFQELQEAHQRLRLSAAREADLATLQERNRLARDMHDSLGHALVSISIKLEAVQRLYAVDVARAIVEMDETKALVRSTMTDLRNSIQGLRPAALEGQTLCAALADMTRELGRRAGVTATCTVDDSVLLVNRAAQEALFRVGQEALTNVAKHARARHVWLSLIVQNDMAMLEVSDDGIGPGLAGNTHSAQFGIQGMRERVDALGGVLTLRPRPEGGATLRASVPIGNVT